MSDSQQQRAWRFESTSVIGHLRLLIGHLRLLIVLTLPLAAGAEDTLDFGLYTSDKPTDMVRLFQPVIRALEDNLAAAVGHPVKIRIQVAKSYELGVDNLTTGRVDFARFGPASYVMAKQSEPNLRIITMEQKKGKKYFYGVICVRQENKQLTVDQLRGKRFAFGNERSTIGRYLSQLYLLDHGLHARDLSGYAYLARHDLVGTSVAAGRYDAGALKEGTYNKLVAKGAPLATLVTFRNVTKPWVAKAGMDDNLFSALQQSLSAITDPKALQALGVDGFVAGEDRDYDTIRESIARNPAFFE
jgi:phosphonate transport system substrate-binding protein